MARRVKFKYKSTARRRGEMSRMMGVEDKVKSKEGKKEVKFKSRLKPMRREISRMTDVDISFKSMDRGGVED